MPEVSLTFLGCCVGLSLEISEEAGAEHTTERCQAMLAR